MLETSTVGRPGETGTLWPFVPQVQPPVSSLASFATIVMRLSDCGPLPMMLTSLIGAVTLPFSTSQPFFT